MARAAEWLTLAAGEAPTASGYKQAAKALGLMPISQILSEYVVWDEAKRDFLGQWRHSSPAQRRLRREAQLNRQQVRTTIALLRLWLDEKQSDDDGMTAYGEWAAERNESAAEPADRVRHPKSILASSGLGWRDLIAVAREEMTPRRSVRTTDRVARAASESAVCSGFFGVCVGGCEVGREPASS